MTKKIYVYPYGGGSAASYRSYVSRFGGDVGQVIPIEIPGRGGRLNEPFAKSIEECAALSTSQLDLAGAEYILHGHCMGALLAFETIKLIKSRGAPLPRFMVASGRNAPGHASDWLRRADKLSDRELFDEMREFGAVPKGLSFAMALPFLSIIRHDQEMFRDYQPGDEKIDVPVLVLAGKEDDMTHENGVADWRRFTSGSVSIEWLDGRHYFIIDYPDRVARSIAKFDAALRS